MVLIKQNFERAKRREKGLQIMDWNTLFLFTAVCAAMFSLAEGVICIVLSRIGKRPPSLLVTAPAACLAVAIVLFADYTWGGDSDRRADVYEPPNVDSLITSVMTANTWGCGPKKKPRAITATLKADTLWFNGKGATRDYHEPTVIVEPWYPGTYEDAMKEYWIFDWAPWRFKSKYDSAVSITDIIVGNGVKKIGGMAFAGLPKLNSVAIPASVSSIDELAFSNCNSNNMFDFSSYSDFNCHYYGLASVNVAAGNARYCSVDGVLFNKNKTVLILYPKDKRQDAYAIPNGVTAIKAGAFLGAGLKSVAIPRSVTSIGKGAFAYSGLTTVTFPGGVAAIENDMFKMCVNLTSITIEEGVKSIDTSAFEDCGSLASVAIPRSVTSIGNMAFYACGSLTAIAFPRGVISIGDGAFARCAGLTSVTIGDGVTSIGGWAFSGCTGLTSVAFSSDVKSIGERVFDKCENLNSVAVLNPVPPGIANETFAGIPAGARLYVPDGRVDAYRHAWRHVWKKFAQVDEIVVAVDTNKSTVSAQTAESGKTGGANTVDKLPPTAFKTVKIGNQTWMAENVNYKTGNSWCYEDNDANCAKYGRLYDFETATAVCPTSWRLPSDDDWEILVAFAGGHETAGKKLKAKRGWKWGGYNCNGTDAYGFSALPGGEYDDYRGFNYAGVIGQWRSTGAYDQIMAHYWRMSCGAKDGSNSYDVNRGGYVRQGGDSKEHGYSVRCILDTAATVGGGRANPAAVKTVKIGEQTWMAENLNDKIVNGRSWCYDNQESNCALYGRLYDWETARIACPAGWHLPSRQEWEILVASSGGGKAAGKALKAQAAWGGDDGKVGGGFSAVPGGFRFTNGVSYDIGVGGDWWTSTEGRSGAAYRRGMSRDSDGAVEDESAKSMGFSVRCLKDD